MVTGQCGAFLDKRGGNNGRAVTKNNIKRSLKNFASQFYLRTMQYFQSHPTLQYGFRKYLATINPLLLYSL